MSLLIKCVTCGKNFECNGRIRRTCGNHSNKYYEDPSDRLLRVFRKNFQNPVYQTRSHQLDNLPDFAFHDWMWYGV